MYIKKNWKRFLTLPWNWGYNKYPLLMEPRPWKFTRSRYVRPHTHTQFGVRVSHKVYVTLEIYTCHLEIMARLTFPQGNYSFYSPHSNNICLPFWKTAMCWKLPITSQTIWDSFVFRIMLRAPALTRIYFFQK